MALDELGERVCRGDVRSFQLRHHFMCLRKPRFSGRSRRSVRPRRSGVPDRDGPWFRVGPGIVTGHANLHMPEVRPPHLLGTFRRLRFKTLPCQSIRCVVTHTIVRPPAVSPSHFADEYPISDGFGSLRQRTAVGMDLPVSGVPFVETKSPGHLGELQEGVASRRHSRVVGETPDVRMTSINWLERSLTRKRTGP